MGAIGRTTLDCSASVDLNAVLVVPQAGLAWWLAARAGGDWVSWWALLAGAAGAGALSSL